MIEIEQKITPSNFFRPNINKEIVGNNKIRGSSILKLMDIKDKLGLTISHLNININ